MRDKNFYNNIYKDVCLRNVKKFTSEEINFIYGEFEIIDTELRLPKSFPKATIFAAFWWDTFVRGFGNFLKFSPKILNGIHKRFKKMPPKFSKVDPKRAPKRF